MPSAHPLYRECMSVSRRLCYGRFHCTYVIDHAIQSSGQSTYKRVVPWAEVLCHAHKHNGQIKKKKNLHALKLMQSIEEVY